MTKFQTGATVDHRHESDLVGGRILCVMSNRDVAVEWPNGRTEVFDPTESLALAAPLPADQDIGPVSGPTEASDQVEDDNLHRRFCARYQAVANPHTAAGPPDYETLYGAALDLASDVIDALSYTLRQARTPIPAPKKLLARTTDNL